MKNIESRTEDAPKKIVKENYFVKVMGYLIDGIKPDKRAPSKRILVYSKPPYNYR